MPHASHQPMPLVAQRVAPIVFVVLWSTGFVGTKFALTGAAPLMMQTVRMAIVLVGLCVIAAVTRPRWPRGVEIVHCIVAGLLVHGFYLGGTAVAIDHAVPAGLSALIPGLQPVLTSTLASRWLGERVTRLQWSGLLLGLAGVLMVLHNRPMGGQAGLGWLASGVALVSITLGTLYQKRFCSPIDWRSGNLVQFAAVAALFAAGALLFETRPIDWTVTFLLSVGWLAVVLSIGSIALLYWLIRGAAATRVASLFYLVPAVTALMAYLLFGETLDAIAIVGMGVCAAGVIVVNSQATRSAA